MKKEIPTNKKELFKFLSDNFPGKWTNRGGFFELTQHDGKKILYNIFFSYTKKKPVNGVYALGYGITYDISLKEATVFYKQYYKMSNFK